jgi:phosphoribosyl 1,2-cyclic phosphate phosphodiesterase
MAEKLEVRILGCGSSGGVPRLGGSEEAGNWGACDSHNPKNRRRRCSILGRLDGVVLTHDHADQTHGMDDLRAVTLNARKRTPVWADQTTWITVMAKFGYCFIQPQDSDYPPILDAHEIHEPFRPFAVTGAGGEVRVVAFAQGHGRLRSMGYRFGPMAYSSDVDNLDDAAFAALSGIECWVVDALRYTPHPSHAHLEKTLSWIARVKPKRAILTNMHLDMDYETLRRDLPQGVEPAFDGMSLEFLAL